MVSAIRKRTEVKGRDLTWPEAPEALPAPIYDNHTHMDFEDGLTVLDTKTSLDMAEQVGVKGVVQVGTDIETSKWSVKLAESDHRVVAAVALHPNEAPKLAKQGVLGEHLSEIARLASHPRVRAIGETGLDFFRTKEDGREAQFESFEVHIEIAKQNNLAMQIHDREAHDDVVKTLLRVGAPEHTVFHCFSGDEELAKICADNGWYLSFAGTVTFKNAQALRDALAITDPSRVLVETDAPFLTPTPYRGRPNAPYLLPHTVRFMADHLQTDLVEFINQITANTVSIYGEWIEESDAN